MERRKNTILYVMPHPRFGKARKQLLEAEGLPVIVVHRLEDLKAACLKHRPRLLIIGYSENPARIRRIRALAREVYAGPLVEFALRGALEASQTSFLGDAEPDPDFVRKIKGILGSGLELRRQIASQDSVAQGD